MRQPILRASLTSPLRRRFGLIAHHDAFKFGVPGCVFCEPESIESDIAFYAIEGELIMVFEPLDPVTPGHLLVVPFQHVDDISGRLGEKVVQSPVIAKTMMIVAELAADVGDCNVITSKGAAATQTVNHLHVHVVPRTEGDGLALPWTGQGEPSLRDAFDAGVDRGVTTADITPFDSAPDFPQWLEDQRDREHRRDRAHH